MRNYSSWRKVGFFPKRGNGMVVTASEYLLSSIKERAWNERNELAVRIRRCFHDTVEQVSK